MIMTIARIDAFRLEAERLDNLATYNIFTDALKQAAGSIRYLLDAIETTQARTPSSSEHKLTALPVGFVSTVNLKNFLEDKLSFPTLVERVVKYETITGDLGVDKYKR